MPNLQMHYRAPLFHMRLATVTVQVRRSVARADLPSEGHF